VMVTSVPPETGPLFGDMDVREYGSSREAHPPPVSPGVGVTVAMPRFLSLLATRVCVVVAVAVVVAVVTAGAVVAAVVVPCVTGATQTEELHTSPVGQALPHPPHASWSDVVSWQ